MENRAIEPDSALSHTFAILSRAIEEFRGMLRYYSTGLKGLLGLLVLVSLAGCLPTRFDVHTQQRASQLLPPACLNLFLGPFQEKILSQQAMYFAIGPDSQGRAAVCAINKVPLFYMSQDERRANALQKCEEVRAGRNHIGQCVIYAYWSGSETEMKVVYSRTPALKSQGQVETKQRDVEPPRQNTQQSSDSLTLETAKRECEELGLTPKTEKFAQCVLELSR